MNFDFSEEQQLLRSTARQFLEEHAPLALARAVLESSDTWSAQLWKAIGDLGWPGTAIPEEYGGSGFGRLELAVLAEELGRTLAPVPFAASVCLAAEAILDLGTEEQKRRHLPALASGARIGTWAVAEGPGEGDLASAATRLTGESLHGSKWPVPDGGTAHVAVVTATDGKEIGLALVDLADAAVRRSELESIDPSRGLTRLDFAGASAEWLGGRPCGGAAIRRIIDRGAVLLAFEQLGGAQRAFELTREFTVGRYAFGRPIASFQALKHRLADVYVEIELARSNAYYGAWAIGNDAPELGIAACGARISASDAFGLAAKEMIQMHGGVGFTWEYDCHLFYRRSTWLSALLGGPSQWRDQLIERLAAQA